MHMNIRLRFLSVLLPLVLIATPLNAAVPKAGAKCSKAKSTATYAGKKFTCVKSGTKLVWNKGVKISVTKPVATPSTSATPKVSGTPTATPTATPTLTSYTMEQVATNNKASSCWTVIDGLVYDLTRFIAAHPGGVATISLLCGNDGTALFTAQHASSPVAAKILKQFILGTIKK